MHLTFIFPPNDDVNVFPSPETSFFLPELRGRDPEMNAEKGLPKLFLLVSRNEYFGRPCAETVHGSVCTDSIILIHSKSIKQMFLAVKINSFFICFSIFFFHFNIFFFISFFHLFILKQMKILLETKKNELLFSHYVLR